MEGAEGEEYVQYHSVGDEEMGRVEIDGTQCLAG